MRLILVGALCALLGCTGKPAVELEPRIVSVDLLVEVPCRTNEVAVPPCAAGLAAVDTLEVKVRALLAEGRPRIGYGRELLAANEAFR